MHVRASVRSVESQPTSERARAHRRAKKRRSSRACRSTSRTASVRAPSAPLIDYDKELLSLRDAINEARLEDIPPLLEEMERLQGVAARRAEVTESHIDPKSPYFGRLVLREGEQKREILIGRGTYLDSRTGVRIVDWRDAPVSRLYYRYDEGDDYDEEFGGREVTGEVVTRRSLAISDGNAAPHRLPAGHLRQDARRPLAARRRQRAPARRAGRGAASRAPSRAGRQARRRRRRRAPHRQVPARDRGDDRSAPVRADHAAELRPGGDPGRRRQRQDHHRSASPGVPRVPGAQALPQATACWSWSSTRRSLATSRACCRRSASRACRWSSTKSGCTKLRREHFPLLPQGSRRRDARRGGRKLKKSPAMLRADRRARRGAVAQSVLRDHARRRSRRSSRRRS